MTDHTGTPWVVDSDGTRIKSSDGKFTAYIVIEFGHEHLPRIVACVNALAGIPQSDLELLAGLSPTTRLMALAGVINRTLGSILP